MLKTPSGLMIPTMREIIRHVRKFTKLYGKCENHDEELVCAYLMGQMDAHHNAGIPVERIAIPGGKADGA